MSIYVIADLHLSLNEPKPMDIFGNNWLNHEEKIKKNWLKAVKDQDTVLILGDFSWAMYMEDAYKDFEYLNNLPGRKVILKGNHDYWWTTVTKMNNFIKENGFSNIDFLYNNSFLVENKIIAGTKGWALTDTENNSKIINREVARLELSLKDGIEKYGKDKEIIACMHYPPISTTINFSHEELKFLNMMIKYNVKKCYYGHLHGNSHKSAVEGNVHGIDFKLVSVDYIEFNLIKLD